MRWITLAAVLVGCGGADCDLGKPRSFDAVRVAITTAACEDLPQSVAVSTAPVPGDATALQITEGAVSFTARTSHAITGCHAIVVADHDGLSRVYSFESDWAHATVAKPGQCVASYDLRRH